MPCASMSGYRLAHLHKSSSSSSTTTAITTSSLLYPDSLAPPTSDRSVSNPMTTKVTTPATTTRTTAVLVSRLDARTTPRPKAGVATSRVLPVTITSKPCCIGASFKWLRLPRKNGRNVAPNEDLVVVCVVLLPAWPPCTPTRTMCPPLLFFLHLLWMVSTSMTKNLCYTYSSTWRPCRTRDVTFRILSWPKPRMTSVQSASGETRACATSWSGWTRRRMRTAERSRCWPTISKGTTVTLSSKSTIVNTALSGKEERCQVVAGHL